MTVATSPVYELWDVEAGNLISDHKDQSAALQSVREGVAEEGPDAWASVALMRVELGGMRAPVAQGSDLIRLARGEGMPPSGAPGAASVGMTGARSMPDWGLSTFAAGVLAKQATDMQAIIDAFAGPTSLSAAIERMLSTYNFSDQIDQTLEPFSFTDAITEAISARQAMLDAIARPAFNFAGALTFAEALRPFPNVGETFAALLVEGMARIEIGPEEKVLKVPATEAVIESLIEDGAMPAREPEAAPPQVVWLRVRVDGYRFEWDPDDDLRAAGD